MYYVCRPCKDGDYTIKNNMDDDVLSSLNHLNVLMEPKIEMKNIKRTTFFVSAQIIKCKTLDVY